MKEGFELYLERIQQSADSDEKEKYSKQGVNVWGTAKRSVLLDHGNLGRASAAQGKMFHIDSGGNEEHLKFIGQTWSSLDRIDALGRSLWQLNITVLQ